MRYGIIADLHGNLEGLTTALKRLDEEGCDEILCLGDIVGYNADPKACTEIVRERCKASVLGNHERMMMGKSREGVRQEVIDVIEWTRKQLAEDDIEFLEGLGEQVHVDERILIVHGSPRDGDEYILSTDAIRENVEMLGQTQPEVRVCFFGHSHFPMVIGLPEIHTRFHETRTIELDPNRLYLINPGSVGQPRDGCSKCAFGLYDSEKSTITIFREEYDMETTQDKILEAGLDPKLAARLQLGK